MQQVIKSTFFKTYILIFILALLAGFVFFFDNPEKIIELENKPFNERLIAGFDPSKASKIALTNQNQTITLEKSNDRWQVMEANPYPADENNVKLLLSTTSELKRENIASKALDQKDYFEVTKEKGLQVEIFNPEKKKIAHFYLGKSGEPNYDDQYARVDRDDQIYKLKGYIKNIFARSLDEWKDKHLLAKSNYKKDLLQEIALKYDDYKLQLVSQNGLFKVTEPDAFDGEKSKVDQFLNIFESMSAESLFIGDKNEFGLTEGAEKVKLFLKLGDDASIMIRFGMQADEQNYYYGEVSGNNYIFKILKESVEGLKVKSDYFKKDAQIEEKK